MSTNLQSRSTSLSASSQAANNSNLRSASIGTSSFFKDSLNFFDEKDLDKSDLDIVGALGTLNLDDELSSTKPITLGADVTRPPAHAATPTLAASGPGSGPIPHLAAFGGMNSLRSSTPSSTWSSNFVPFTAPPFSYLFSDPALTSEMAMQIAPFQLPDEGSFQPGTFLLPNEGSEPMPKVEAPRFGGALDESFMRFDEKKPEQRYDSTQQNLWTRQPYRDAEPARNYNQNVGYRRNYSAGVNVHRKMHSSRRKGDDAAKYASAKLEDFSGEIYSLCKDQHGCRFLQRQLDGSHVAATMIFNEIYLRIVELMIDPFGNYLIQKLFENVLADQRLVLVKNAAPDFVRIALDPHGTRALQKLVECIKLPEETRLLVASLRPHVVALSRDLNGNHVVQKCLQMLKADDNQFIFDAAAAHCSEIATHRHGCCVLQRCLDHGSAQQRLRLSMKVAEVATSLLLDPFGNYVVQYVLSRGDDALVAVIVEHIRANVISLSLHKFGLNVIERSLRIHRLTDTVVAVLLANADNFSTLLNDAFGNYVLQTSLDVANSADLAKLARALQPYLTTIKNTPHGRRILTKIQNIQ